MDFLTNMLAMKQKEDADSLHPLSLMSGQAPPIDTQPGQMMSMPGQQLPDASALKKAQAASPIPAKQGVKIAAKVAAETLQKFANPQAPETPDQVLNTRMREYLDAQKKGISGLEEQSAALQRPSGVNNLTLMLAGISDTLGNNTEKNLPGLLQMNQNAQDKFDEKKMKYAENLQKARDSYSKEEISFLGKQIADKKAAQGESDLKRALVESSIARNNSVAGFNNTGRQGMYDTTLHSKVMNLVDKDPILKQRSIQYSNLSNGLAAAEKPKITPVQQVHELQQVIRKNMGIGGSSGVSERGDTYINSVGMDKAKFMQYLSGDPQDVAKNHPELIHHLKEVARIEMENVKEQSDKRLATLTSGYQNALYGHRPDLYEDLNSKVKGTQNQFTEVAPQGVDKPETIEQDGHTYKLNKVTGEYE